MDIKHPYENKKDQISPDNHEYSVSSLDKSRCNLRADCENCFGLCCVALYFSASEGFPINKEPGQPCINLQSDFRCCVYKSLWEKGLKGCIAFDCFGAGQKVAQISFNKIDWDKSPESAKQMFEVFLIMRQLHEMLWYMTEALTFQAAYPIHEAIRSMLDDTERLTYLSPDSLLKMDIAGHREKVNVLLIKTSELVRAEIRHDQISKLGYKRTLGQGADLIGADLRTADLRGANLRNAYLIAADLRGNDLSYTDFIGADFRDADLKGADLTKSIFLTQDQLNSAKGDAGTKIPPSITRPKHWGTFIK